MSSVYCRVGSQATEKASLLRVAEAPVVPPGVVTFAPHGTRGEGSRAGGHLGIRVQGQMQIPTGPASIFDLEVESFVRIVQCPNVVFNPHSAGGEAALVSLRSGPHIHPEGVTHRSPGSPGVPVPCTTCTLSSTSTRFQTQNRVLLFPLETMRLPPHQPPQGASLTLCLLF